MATMLNFVTKLCWVIQSWKDIACFVGNWPNSIFKTGKKEQFGTYKIELGESDTLAAETLDKKATKTFKLHVYDIF